MKSFLYIVSISLSSAFLNPACAYAERWEHNINGPDVFGETTGLAAVYDENQGLAVECSSKGKLLVAFIQAKSGSAYGIGENFKILVTDPEAGVVEASALFREWNHKYNGYVVESVELARKFINAFNHSIENIQIGVTRDDFKLSRAFSARGSTFALNSIILACKLNS